VDGPALVEMAGVYGAAALPGIDYRVRIDHLYPIPDDEEAERQRDLDEVARGARSRLGFIRKWQPDADASAEMRQIDAEKRAPGAME
jgi:hypothetical protein